ncbi:MAG: hypothetical protein ACREPL_15125 [Rhodanobacteraceae bacterium]
MRRQGFCVPPRVNQTVGKRVSFQSAATVQVVFNNNYEDQGQRNARTLQRLLTK